MNTSMKILRSLKCIVYPIRITVNEMHVGKKLLCSKTIQPFLIHTNSFKSYSLLLSQEKFIRDPTRIIKSDGTVIRKKTIPEVKINLIKGSEMTVLTLQAAENIAKANDLNLVKVKENIKSTRETYKLVSDSELANESVSQSHNKNDSKTFVVSSVILDHDLKIKLKLMMKNLKKNLNVKCIIKQIGKEEGMTAVFEKIKQELKKEDLPLSITVLKSTNTIMNILIQNVGNKNNNLVTPTKNDAT